jgi:hypothetical protein
VEAMRWLEGFGDEAAVQKEALEAAQRLIKGGNLP